ncbi:MAG: hydrogenase iron-sulfur subunit [Syntrophales bacterium]|jgi:F420-non-reducing hydrogenase iron-sulfur subunit|nr:hydrogenase iron-sulfur subunit [Syntrophales bacterium]MCK9528552.1 hydrogenase iron-sulfur subunit [Syntrophales bacterium]MDX9922821.1 hydrogenase iron-sulfur subunit [Syntrophales bacterium]
MTKTGTPEIPIETTRPAVDARLLVFACKWCGLIGADGAGRKRIALPPNFRVIPVECAASVEPDAVIRAFADGIDGVVVMGCHLGGCRFNDANHTAVKRLELLRELLDGTGIGRDRLLVSFGTAHEDHQFAGIIQDFTALIKTKKPLSPWIPFRAGAVKEYR